MYRVMLGDIFIDILYAKSVTKKRAIFFIKTAVFFYPFKYLYILVVARQLNYGNMFFDNNS